MAGTNDSLDRIEVASPCTQSWDAMTGDAKRRYCGECRLHVHNLSAMTSDEAAGLLDNADGRLCVRFFRRPDGTVLTRDCVPVRERLRRRVRRLRVAAAALFGFLYPLGLAGCGGTDGAGQSVPSPGGIEAPEHGIEPTMGEPIQGDICVPEEELHPVPAETGGTEDADETDGTDESDVDAAVEELGKIAQPHETIGRIMIR
jgi:hypothetical protein